MSLVDVGAQLWGRCHQQPTLYRWGSHGLGSRVGLGWRTLLSVITCSSSQRQLFSARLRHLGHLVPWKSGMFCCDVHFGPGAKQNRCTRYHPNHSPLLHLLEARKESWWICWVWPVGATAGVRGARLLSSDHTGLLVSGFNSCPLPAASAPEPGVPPSCNFSTVYLWPMSDTQETCSEVQPGKGCFQGTGQRRGKDSKSFDTLFKQPQKAETRIKSYGCVRLFRQMEVDTGCL